MLESTVVMVRKSPYIPITFSEFFLTNCIGGNRGNYKSADFYAGYTPEKMFKISQCSSVYTIIV